MNIMLDLETLGTRAGCSILDIGAIAFTETEVTDDSFSILVDRASCTRVGLVEDPATLEWWGRQAPEARKLLDLAVKNTAYGIGDALSDFAHWFYGFHKLHHEVRIWSNGASFDLPILAEAYHRCGWNGAPWRGGVDDRCYRTLKNLRPDVKSPVENLQKHDALADATYQAHHAVAIFKALRG